MTRRLPLLTLVTTGLGLFLALVFHLAGFDLAPDVALIGAALIPLTPLISEMVSKLRRGQPGVDVIALLAVAGALALGELLTAAIVGLMLATGQFLEEYAAGRAERELTTLVERAPRTAHRIHDGAIEAIDVRDVVRGDQLVVKAGEVVPVDGVVITELAVLDESALTGEPLPVERHTGDLVSSGVINAADTFEMQATDDAETSTYAGIVRLVESARTSRAPAVRLADRWAGWFVPLTLAVAGIAWIVSGEPDRALAVLVVATPCPLLLAVPIAIVSGISRAARRGIVFRGGGALETIGRTRNVVIDKTGTVTVGRPSLRSVTLFQDHTDEEAVVRLAASVDQVSTHVLARAIVEAARARGITLSVPSGVSEDHGFGVSAKVGSRDVGVGRLRWLLDDRPEPEPVAQFRTRIGRLAPSAVYVSIDGEIAAALVFDDQIRPDAAMTIRALRRLGVSDVVMATGDHPVVARAVGMAVGADEVLAEATPRDKVQVLEELRGAGITTMVGDGINDAPALAAADVGVAMGARGATASSEAADVVLVVDQLGRVVDAIEIAQRSTRIAVQSVVVGMGLSVAAMSVASLGLLAPLAGALVQEAIDVIAILNALRALREDGARRRVPKLSAAQSASLHAEHARLRPLIDEVRDIADELDSLSGADVDAALTRIDSLLVEEILPHEEADEHEVYPEVSRMLPGDDPLATMSRTHREIFHLVDVLQGQISEIPAGGPDRADVRDLRRVLYGLHAILRLHFDQEEELYLSLQDDH